MFRKSLSLCDTLLLFIYKKCGAAISFDTEERREKVNTRSILQIAIAVVLCSLDRKIYTIYISPNPFSS